MHRVKRALHHIHHESGQMLVLMVAGLAAFVAIVGLSVDVGQIVFTRTDLQKVADAAAFAGAQDLPSSSAATVSANTYVGLNAANTTADVAISQTYNANDTIRVTARRKVNYTFMRVLGLTGTDVSASATVRVGTYNGGSGLVPWGLVASDNSDFLGNECFAGFDGEMPLFNQNTVCTLKYGAGENSGGDFGIVALDGTGSDIYEYGIINGSTTVYEVGDQVNPQTGNNVGKTRSGIDGRLARPLPEDCQTHDRNEILHTDPATGLTTIAPGCETHPRIMIIPVLDQLENPQPSTIVGFAFMYLHSVSGNGGHTKINAEFVSFTTRIPGGTYGGPVDGQSSTAIMLIE